MSAAHASYTGAHASYSDISADPRWVQSPSVDPQALQGEALAAIEAASSPAELDDARVRYLGRSSELKLALREVRDRETGMALNAVREALEAAFAARQEELERAELSERLTTERADVTLPAALLGDVRLRPRGTL